MRKSFRNTLYHATHWETWHYLAKYIPIMPVWLWYCLKARSFWFFTPSNPTLTFGGFEGERKMEMYEKLPPGSYPKTVHVNHSLSFEALGLLVKNNSYVYPFAVKPDVGMMGFMFRQIHSWEELKKYHKKMPADYLLQELVRFPIEVSVFYYRFPEKEKGRITGFIRKEFMQVKGNGRSTLLELMTDYPRVQFRLEEMKSKHANRLHQVIPAGEAYYLSHALNLSRGGKLVSLEKEKDDSLLKVFDEISHYAGDFYYGRYDIKCKSIEDLKQGRNFLILEYNGSGAEPHHAYGNGHTLLQAYQIFLHHWKVLYNISKQNHKKGLPYWEFKNGLHYLREAKRHFRLLKQLDLETEL